MQRPLLDPALRLSSHPPHPTAIRYRPEIDGLRAVAVLPVVLFHAGLEFVSGGYVGVDIFFVISGFLITSILLRDLQFHRFGPASFYERRARRILPALFLVTGATLPPALLLLHPSGLESYFDSIAALAWFGSNIQFYWEADYFDTASEMKPLLHTWTLAVEEQFYLFFPPILWLVWKGGRALLWAFVLATFAASLAIAEGWLASDHSAAFYLLPSRAFELAVGGAVALHAHWRPGLPAPGLAQAGSLAGLLLIAIAVFAFEEATPFPGTMALVPTLGAALVILFAVPGSLAHRLLSLRAMVGIGLVSYSAYLWHQPLIAFARHAAWIEPAPSTMAGMVALTFVLAFLSWKYVENPLRNRRILSRGAIFALSAAGLACLAAIGLVGSEYRYRIAHYTKRPDIALLDYRMDNRELLAASWAPLRRRAANPGYRADGNPEDREMWFDPADGRARLLVVGNSHSKDMYNILSASERAAARFQIARYGSQIADIDEVFYRSPNYRAADVVLLVSLFSEEDIAAFGRVLRRIERDGKLAAIARGSHSWPEYKNRMLTMGDAAVIRAYLAGERDGAVIADAGNRAMYAQWRDEGGDGVLARSNEAIDALDAALPGLVVLDRMRLLCSAAERRCFGLDARLNKSFYDNMHVTIEGARLFGRRLDEIGWLAEVERAAGVQAASRGE